jgi:hypothetical protein
MAGLTRAGLTRARHATAAGSRADAPQMSEPHDAGADRTWSRPFRFADLRMSEMRARPKYE